MGPATIPTVHSVALCHNRPIHQLHVKNDFLLGTLTRTVYCEQASRFVLLLVEMLCVISIGHYMVEVSSSCIIYYISFLHSFTYKVEHQLKGGNELSYFFFHLIFVF